MVKNVEKQDYPKDKFEWIIIDDGDDCIEDLYQRFETNLNIKYYRYEEKIKLGKKEI